MQSRSFNLIEQQNQIQEIKNSDNPTLYILNNTDRPGRDNKPTREPGLLALTVLVNGVARVVRVPVSWVPVDAGLQAPKKDIIDSAEFQRALAAQAIIVFTHKQGQDIIMADLDSQNEYSRIMAVAQQINGPDSEFQGLSGSDSKDEVDEWANVTQAIKLMVDEIQGGHANITELKTYVRRNSRSVTPLDMRYINEKLPDYADGGHVSGATLVGN